MTNPYRAMCAELVEALHEHICLYEGQGFGRELVARARALLAQPVAEGPTDEELWAAGSDDFRAITVTRLTPAYARALLAQPVAEEPTDEDVFDLCEDLGFEMSNFEESAGILLEMFRAVLAKWGRQ